MELTSTKVIKNLLKKQGAAPLKRFGQNFLVDKLILEKIVESTDLQSSDVVLEIGPGIGTLTREIAKRVKKVIAIEKDPKMCEILKGLLECWNVRNVEIIEGDILKIKLPIYQLPTANYKLIANLPYYIVSPVIRKFLESEKPPKEMILMVQKEVAQRICPRPPKLEERKRGKTTRMNLLAVSVQFYAKPEILFYVPKNSFWPRPKVDGAVIKIVPNSPLVFSTIVKNTSKKNLFFRIVKAGFVQPRKQLCNNLANGLKLSKTEVKNWLLENGVSTNQRAETLSIEDWVSLTKKFKVNL